MKHGVFVEGLSNVIRFIEGARVVEKRGAPEACWLLAKGDPGYGKTKTVLWWGLRNTQVIVRAKADWTPLWALKDIARCLGLQQTHYKEALFGAVCTELMSRGCPPLVIDEIDHAARSYRVLETLRDITDVAECMLVAAGMKDVEGLLKRYPQIHSRIAEIVNFGPASVKDCAAMCEALSEVPVAPCMVEEIQKRTQGRLRHVMNAIGRVEQFGKGGRAAVTAASFGNRPLLNNERHRSAANG